MFAITHAQNRTCTVVMLWQNAVHLLNLDPMVIILIAQEIQIFREKKNDGYNRMSSEVLVKCANKNKLSLWSKQLLLQGHLYCRHDIAIGFLLGHATHF